jgi:hypothetical protein
MKKIEKLSRDEMRYVLGGNMVTDCEVSSCGDGVHSCNDGYKCTAVDCCTKDQFESVFLKCIAVPPVE